MEEMLFFSIVVCGIQMVLGIVIVVTFGMFAMKYFCWLNKKLFPNLFNNMED